MGVVRFDPVGVFAGYRLGAIAVADTGREPPERSEIVETGVTLLDDGTIGQTSTWPAHPQRTIAAWAAWATQGPRITNNEMATVPAPGTVPASGTVAEQTAPSIVPEGQPR